VNSMSGDRDFADLYHCREDSASILPRDMP
jgi:hypothetical protein